MSDHYCMELLVWTRGTHLSCVGKLSMLAAAEICLGKLSVSMRTSDVFQDVLLQHWDSLTSLALLVCHHVIQEKDVAYQLAPLPCHI